MVSWGTNTGIYMTTTNVGNSTTGTVSGLTDGRMYYFVVRAYNTSLVESSNSAELAWLAPVPAPPDTTPPVIQAPTPVTLTAGLDDKAPVPDFLTGLSVTDDRTPATNIVLSQFPVAGHQVATGTTSVIITAMDASTNLAQVTVALTVLMANRAPIVNAGQDITFMADKSGTLYGSITDDALPAGATVVATWSKLSGPGILTFGNTNSASTSIRASLEGTYVIQLLATDQLLSGSDTVTVTVLPRAVPVKPANVRVVMTTQDLISPTSTTYTATSK
jgi:hypothetical protein